MNKQAECSTMFPCEDGCIKPAYAFVAMPEVTRFYDYESALIAGTVFPDLCIPKGKYGPKESYI